MSISTYERQKRYKAVVAALRRAKSIAERAQSLSEWDTSSIDAANFALVANRVDSALAVVDHVTVRDRRRGHRRR